MGFSPWAQLPAPWSPATRCSPHMCGLARQRESSGPSTFLPLIFMARQPVAQLTAWLYCWPRCCPAVDFRGFFRFRASSCPTGVPPWSRVCTLGKREGQPASTWEGSARSRACLFPTLSQRTRGAPGRGEEPAKPSYLAGLHVLVLIGAIAWAYRAPSGCTGKGESLPLPPVSGLQPGKRPAMSWFSSGKGRGVANPNGPAARPRSPGPPFSCRQDAPGMPRPLGPEHRAQPFTLPFSRLVFWLHVCLPIHPKEKPTQGRYGPRVGVRGILVDATNKDSVYSVIKVRPRRGSQAGSRRYHRFGKGRSPIIPRREPLTLSRAKAAGSTLAGILCPVNRPPASNGHAPQKAFQLLPCPVCPTPCARFPGYCARTRKRF